jgi:hypothetical protein
MSSRHLSLRLEHDTFDRLNEASKRAGLNRSTLARTLLEEGLRMEKHPGIIFRPGPFGRRPALIGGPDIWEIARLMSQIDEEGDALIEQTAELSDLPVRQVRTAIRYYAEFREDIDEWIARVDEEAARAEEEWLHEQDLLRT